MTRKVFAMAAKKVAAPTLTPAVVRPFLTDVAELRRRARREIEEGAVTPGYGADREAVVRLLNISLATEIVCVLRYKRHYFMADGIHAKSVKAEFLEHAKEEQAHADGLCERIRQLGGEPDLNPSGLLSKSHTEYQEGSTLVEMIREDLIAERIAIESYKELIAYVGESDTTTRRLFEWILGQEEEHADDLADLLRSFDGEKKGHR
jgi:bacterioferritin